ncbi:MAG TPA: hypothetical protein VII61_09815 [Ktedonobacteraceae bacterium]
MTQEIAKTVEILHEERGLRVVRLDFTHYGYESEDVLAQLGEGLVTLTRMRSDHKPKNFTIDPQNMDRLTTAWLQFRADNLAKLEAEKAVFWDEIEETRKRAQALGADMASYLTSSDYTNFTLKWPDSSPLAPFNHRWMSNTDLSLGSVQSRLETVEKHIQSVQDEAVDDKREISSTAEFIRRAELISANFSMTDETDVNGVSAYGLTFPEDHPFYKFWERSYFLTPGQVEYRLRYVEGVLNAAK